VAELTPTLAAANRLTHGAYPATLAGRQQREVDVQLVAGDYILAANALGAIARNADAFHKGEEGKTRALQVIAQWAHDPASIPEGV
jgi:hypothetical protein